MQYRDGGGPNGGGDGQDYYYKNRQKVIEPIKGTKVAVSSQSGPTSICGRLLDSSVVAGGLSGIPITPNSVQAGMMGGTAYPAPTYQAGASATATAIGALSSRVDVGVTLTNVPQDANVMRVMWCFRKTGTTNWSPWAETTIPGAPAPATTLAVTFTYGDIQSGVAYDYGLAYVSARGDLGAISAFISNQAAASVSIPGTYFVGGSSTPITPTTSGSPTTTAAGQVAGVTQAARMQFTASNQPTDGSLSRIGLWYRQTGTSAWTNWSEIAANGTGIYDVTITSLHNGVGYDFGFTYVSIAGAESTIYSLPSLASTALSVGTNFLKAGVGTAPTLSPSFVSSIVNSAGGMTSDLTLTWTTTNEPTDGSLMGIAVFLQTVGGGGSSLYAEIALAGSHAYSFTFTGLHNGASYVVSLAYAYTNGTYGSTISSSTIALPAIGIPIAYQLGGTGTPPVISGGAGTTGTPTSPNGVSTAVPITFTITNQPTDGSLSRLAFFYRVTGAGSWTYYASIPATGVGTLTPPASSGSMTFVYADLTNGQGYDFGVAFENAQGGESAVTSLATMTIQQLSLPATSATPMPGGQTLSAASSGIGVFSGVGGPNALLPFTMTYNDWTVGNAPGWFLAVTAYFRVNGSGSTTGTVLGDFIPGAGTNAVSGTAALPAGGTFDIGFAYCDGRNNHSTITWPAGTSGIVVPGVANTALVKMPSAIKSAGPAVTGSVSVRTARGGTTQTITTTFTETDFTTTPSWFNGAVIVVRINGDTDGARQTTVFASQISAGGVCTKVIPVTVGETIDVGLFYLDVYGDASATTWYVSASADPNGGFIDTTDPNKGVSHTRSSTSTRAVVNSDKTTNLTDFNNTVEADPTSAQAGLWVSSLASTYAWSKSGATLSVGLGPEVFEWSFYGTSGDSALIVNAGGYAGNGPPTSGYMAYVDHNGAIRLYKMVSGAWSQVASATYASATNVNLSYLHHMKVVVQGIGSNVQIAMQFDQSTLLVYSDTSATNTAGTFGLLGSGTLYTHDFTAKQSVADAQAIVSSPNIDVQTGNVTGGVDFTKTHIGKTLDSIPDGSVSVSLPVGNVTGSGASKRALIDLTQGHVGKNIDNLVEGSTNKYFNGKTLDNLPDGSTYVSLPAANVAGSGATKRALIDLSGSHINTLPLAKSDLMLQKRAVLTFNNVTARTDGLFQTALSTNCFTNTSWNLPAQSLTSVLTFDFSASISDTANSYENIFFLCNVNTNTTPTTGYVFERVSTAGHWALYKYPGSTSPVNPTLIVQNPITPDTNKHRYVVTITNPSSANAIIALYIDGVLASQYSDNRVTNGVVPTSGYFGISANSPTYWIVDPESFLVTMGAEALESLHSAVKGLINADGSVNAANPNLAPNADFAVTGGTVFQTGTSGTIPKFYAAENGGTDTGIVYAVDAAAAPPAGPTGNAIKVTYSSNVSSKGLMFGGAWDGAQPFVLKANTKYVFSFYAKSSVASTTFIASTFSGSGVTAATAIGAANYADTAWHRYAVLLTIGTADTTPNLLMYTNTAGAASVWFAAPQIEEGSVLSVWSGPIHGWIDLGLPLQGVLPLTRTVADLTSANTALNVTNVNGTAAATVESGALRARAVIDASNQVSTSTPFTAQGSMQPYTTDFVLHTIISGTSPNITVKYWIDNGTASTNVTFYRANGVNLVCAFNGTSAAPMGTATTTMATGDTVYFMVYWSLGSSTWVVSAQKNTQFTPAQIGAAYVDGLAATLASVSGGSNGIGTGGGTIAGCPEINEPIECRRDGAILTLRAGDLRVGDELRDFDPGEWNRINDFKVGPAMIHEIRFVDRERPMRVDASHLFVPANGEGWINVANLHPGSALKRTGGELIVESQVQIGWGQMAHISCDRMRYLFDETSSHNVKYR